MGILDLVEQSNNTIVDNSITPLSKDLYKAELKAKFDKKRKDSQKNRCEHNKFMYQKWIHNGKIQGKTFHYKKICLDCNRQKFVKRTKEVYEVVKSQKWHFKKK